MCHAPVVMFPLLRRVSTHLGIGPSAYLPVLRPALVSTAVMTVGVLAIAFVVPPSTPHLATLAIKVTVGGACYAAALWFLFRERVLALVRVAMQLRGDAAAPAAAP